MNSELGFAGGVALGFVSFWLFYVYVRPSAIERAGVLAGEAAARQVGNLPIVASIVRGVTVQVLTEKLP